MKRTVDGTVECLIMKSLNLFDRDPVAKEAFLSRISTRYIPVGGATADKFAAAKKALLSKVGDETAGLSLQLSDDVINRALDRAEAKVARRRKR